MRHVKENFLAGREFHDLTRLNTEALTWCARQGGRYRRAVDCVPADEHAQRCMPAAAALELTDEVSMYLCPRRRVSFDGFVTYEGRRFGVPYWHEGRDVRVSREGEYLHIYNDDLTRELAVHPVTWSRRDSVCEDQWADAEPLELPTQPVTTYVRAVGRSANPAFDKFDFAGRL